MESLRKLEQLQSTILFMKSQHFVASNFTNPNSLRFLANLILFLTQPCGELDLETKCALVSDYIPKISVGFLEKASLCLSHNGFQQQILEENSQLNAYNESNSNSLQTNIDERAMVGLDAMQRANSTLEDFLDTLNEKIVHAPTDESKSSLKGSKEANPRSVAKFMDVIKHDPFRSLASVLDSHGFLSERIKEEFQHGQEYWDLERMLCGALANGNEIYVEDVIKAIYLKSFDYRVLNLLLYQLRDEQVVHMTFAATVKIDELHMEFLSVSEFLVEISDDLFDYEDDVLENSFNVLRMFVRIYGTSAPTMLAKYITEAEEKYNILLKSLDPKLSSDYQRRCEEATREGGNTAKYALGTWSIPPLILDEELYRSNLLLLEAK